MSEVQENLGLLKNIQVVLSKESILDQDLKEGLSLARVEAECYLAIKVRDFVNWEWKKEVWQLESILVASYLGKREYERTQAFFDLVEETKRNIFALNREIQDSFQFCIDIPRIGQIRLAEINKDNWQSLNRVIDRAIELSAVIIGKGYI